MRHRVVGIVLVAVALVLPRAASAAGALDTAPSRFATVDGIRVHDKSIGDHRAAGMTNEGDVP